MCSILGIFNIKSNQAELRKQALDMSRKLRHRGPDWSGIFVNDSAIITHERLAIVDVENGSQPLYSKDGQLVLSVNGEIYNHKELESSLETDYEFLTKSDCEVILALYREKGVDFLNELNGIFAFVLYDIKTGNYFIARDHIGIVPLYTGHDEHGNFYVASEMKALTDYCKSIEEFPPGHYLSSKDSRVTKYYDRPWVDYKNVKDNQTNKKELKHALEEAVHRQLMSDVPYGILLSGGLDSSLIAAIAKKYAARRIETNDLADAWWPQTSYICNRAARVS